MSLLSVRPKTFQRVAHKNRFKGSVIAQTSILQQLRKKR